MKCKDLYNYSPQPTALHPSIDYWNSLLADLSTVSLNPFLAQLARFSSKKTKHLVLAFRINSKHLRRREPISIKNTECGTGLGLNGLCILLAFRMNPEPHLQTVFHTPSPVVSNYRTESHCIDNYIFSDGETQSSLSKRMIFACFCFPLWLAQ